MATAKQTLGTSCFELKASLFTLPILQLLSSNTETLPEQLASKATQAPNFFQGTPIVIDLKKLPSEADIDFAWLNQTLRAHSMIPVGVRSGSKKQQTDAKLAGFATLPEKKEDISTHKPQKANKTSKKTAESENKLANTNKIITSPIRSGQQVYAEQGDLIVVAPVSKGAEIFAHDNIHIYGPLRGRALAGVNGDENARIFCHKLEAELVAIAGQYTTFEHNEATSQPGPLQIRLKNDQIVVEAFEI